MKTANLRSEFISFFYDRGHREVASSSLVPQNDPTLLFTNAGMNQFKDPLLGRQDLGFSRAVSSQRCVRAGGKHNDLENVGYTSRHHTFFEMLGNFSFGDYFKEETISWAWEFCESVLQLPPEKIWITVHPDDKESRELWEKHIGFPSDRIIDLEDNFWSMGESGPCGPCSELFFDHGRSVAGGPPGSKDEDGDRFVEFWNLVFPQFDRQPDGNLEPLPQAGVDTGMGLERLAAIMQEVTSNYEIDLFRSLLLDVGRAAKISELDSCLRNPSVRIIADHIRSSAFLVADGVFPGNEDRSYVLRRIIRRALRHGYKLGIEEPFFHSLVPNLASEMGAAYPVLSDKQQDIAKILLKEEEQFAQTLSQGMELLEKAITGLEDPIIPGEIAFQLYDTFGFPVDLTADIARERELAVDLQQFDVLMAEQKNRGRASARFSANISQQIIAEGKTAFVGHDQIESELKVEQLFSMDQKAVKQLDADSQGIIIFDQTPFYAESGGQVGDSGIIVGNGVKFAVRDTQVSGDHHIHIGYVIEGKVEIGMVAKGQVDDRRREEIVKNHSATHLMHAALREILGSHVEQKGSLVTYDRLRFDFSHGDSLSDSEIKAVVDLVNERIQRNVPVSAKQMPYQTAIESGAMALFGEKYGEEVRVLEMGEGDQRYSVELCGGTHVNRTGDIGCFVIISETGIASGVRRIEALSGQRALQWYQEKYGILQQITNMVKASQDEGVQKIQGLLDRNKELVRELNEARRSATHAMGLDLLNSAKEVGKGRVVVGRLDGSVDSLLDASDDLKSRGDDLIIALAGEHNGSVNLVVSVSKKLTDSILAPELLGVIAGKVGAKGGGRPDLARAGGGTEIREIDNALALVLPWVIERLED